MTPTRTPLATFLGNLEREGFSLRLDGADELLVFPGERLTPEIEAGIREYRADLIELLRVHGDALLPLFSYGPGEEVSDTSVSWRLGPSGPGWVAVYSNLLGETVVWTRDESVIPPAEVKGLVRYTRAELEILATGTEEALREIHRTKKTLGGRVTAVNATSAAPAGRLMA